MPIKEELAKPMDPHKLVNSVFFVFRAKALS